MRWYICLLLLVAGLAGGSVTTAREAASKVKYRGERCYMYRFTLKDKHGTPYSIDKPREYLSRRAVERRRRQGLRVDSTDLPVSPRYLQLFRIDGVRVIGTSRWHNSVLVRMTDTTLVATLRSFDCVTGCVRVWQSPDSIVRDPVSTRFNTAFNQWDTIKGSHYGAADEQIRMLNGQRLHEAGYTGRGMIIAVLDGGFMNADRIPAFTGINIKGSHDFVGQAVEGLPYSNISGSRKYKDAGDEELFRGADHGTKVLSAMAVNVPNVYVGTAPGAAYWLLRCEDRHTEQPVEEDYWTMAAEFADSVGADIINSSLGYNEFDNHAGDHLYHELDGHTAFISQSASMLAGKGIILVSSVGNSGMGQWKKIVFPSDATDILSVGAVTPQLTNAPFCGVGPTQDGRVKPDVMALGSPASVISGRGAVVQDMGTSFATPIVCGLMACLWQAHQHLTARDIIEVVRQSGNNHDHPDNIYGYGLPDFGKADSLAKLIDSTNQTVFSTSPSTGKLF